MPTEAQITANQDNAQLSTGPTTAEGKAIVSKNALKTGLTGRTVLLPTDDAAQYAQLVESVRSQFKPKGDAETRLIQSIADTHWRLARIPGLEAALYAVGTAKLSDLHPQVKDEDHRRSMINVEVFLAYERQFRNLQIQESRLRRNLEKDMAALKTLQDLRTMENSAQLTEAARKLIVAIKNGQGRNWDPQQNGFEFSLGEIEKRALEIDPPTVNPYLANKPRHLRNAA